jgi:hypothetical protein
MTTQNIALKRRADFQRFSQIWYQRLFAHELQKSDMHPTPWLACDCMPGMKDSKLVWPTTFGNRSEKPAKKRLRSGVPELSGYLRRSP